MKIRTLLVSKNWGPMGDGAGGFAAASNIGTTSGPLGLEAADLNLDDDLDLCVCLFFHNRGADSVW